jgi:phage terminase small subunit
MPRKSAASLSVVSIDARASRLRPPASLSEPERELFAKIVGTNKPAHFQPSDLTLLARYCELSVLAETAAGHLRDEGSVIAGRVNPWLTVQEKAVRGLVALSMRLRLSPQARAPNNPGTKQQPPSSYYDIVRAQNEEDQRD